MNVPDYMLGTAQAALYAEEDACRKRAHWAVVLALTPKLDGDQWCILWGADLQSGVAGFGDSPETAILDFDRAMGEKAAKQEKPR